MAKLEAIDLRQIKDNFDWDIGMRELYEAHARRDAKIDKVVTESEVAAARSGRVVWESGTGVALADGGTPTEQPFVIQGELAPGWAVQYDDGTPLPTSPKHCKHHNQRCEAGDHVTLQPSQAEDGPRGRRQNEDVLVAQYRIDLMLAEKAVRRSLREWPVCSESGDALKLKWRLDGLEAHEQCFWYCAHCASQK